jgi:hypothetical protein
MPDTGAMEDCKIIFFGRTIEFVNGFAANDPESTKQIWEISLKKFANVETKIMIINSRIDRPDRSRQLGQALPSWEPADRYILIGTGSHFIVKYAVKVRL